ncbi:uncharacterized protein THITE_2110656 [Thermothielavioides terrestris NRRL 8126]|uniref:Protein sip5 n=1 Tax=Thermothielavioides terrestris (strain ATCC 38088 / NRRL 8126) TaxID=578455 RepID=G2QU21_THETT|nr:uncharacterized protein THITE_2110656 [Thermothielavioides terrestris NRRL 8126]AEO64482.1 hypothetical protein THITE_2110656 [Thermothielavioides terrestris NRRL 8126]
MGNASTKESRSGDASHRAHHSGAPVAHETGGGASLQPERSSGRRHRASRGDLGGILGLGSGGGSSSQPEPPYERRETKQEREARRLERERLARIAERERSMKEEHVDGGYLVTMGIYTSPEDFNKQIVRQLQIERKLAPFWRGLNDFSDQWTEPQIIAAARGLPIPPADQTPSEELIPRPPPARSREETAPDLDSLTVPIGDRSPSATSEPGTSNPASALSSPVSSQHPRASSPFRPRGKAIASVFGASSRNGSTTEIAPREVQLPHDPFVNGQPLEVFLYKDATECPICFMSYPPYLNHTRCCDQPICSECFVQIKRPDPHFPEGHNENDPNHNPEEAAGLLVSEPACCPYCTQPDFGVVYEPPPFRRGLAYAISPTALGTTSTAMSSSSSVNSVNASGGLGSPSSGTGRRRNQSLSASSPSVVLTDRIRPEWATKLQAARAHQARRAAAATALHAAAFLMGNSDNRAFRSRFGRRNTGGSGSAAANNGDGENGDSGSGTPSQSGPDQSRRGGSGGGRGSGRTNIDDLEEMMFAEAIRLSLADEEERKRKAEKEERKAAKKREKEARKAAKAAAKQAGPYEGASSRSGQTSASGSSLSLPGLSFGRKRGNSAASNLRVEASVASALAAGDSPAPDLNYKDKGKGVDRSLQTDSTLTTAADPAVPGSSANPSTSRPTPHLPAGPSHLRQMSNASSVSSSVLDSQHGSYSSPSHLQDPCGSGLSLGSRSGASEDGGDQDRDRDPSASTEPMFNFRSLAEVVGVSLEGKDAGGAPSQTEAERAAQDSAHPESLEDERARIDETGNAGLAPENRTTEGVRENKQAEPHDTADTAPATSSPIPEVTITPDTPATVSVDDDSKQIGGEAAVERVDMATQ